MPISLWLLRTIRHAAKSIWYYAIIYVVIQSMYELSIEPNFWAKTDAVPKTLSKMTAGKRLMYQEADTS